MLSRGAVVLLVLVPDALVFAHRITADVSIVSLLLVH
jgi:hypothetical protein